ncbi:hypothetical protein NKH36_13840 [Mesorhizobium sp. M1312]
MKISRPSGWLKRWRSSWSHLVRPNRGWLVDDAIRVIKALRETDDRESLRHLRGVPDGRPAHRCADHARQGARQTAALPRGGREPVLDVASLKTSCIDGIEATRQAMSLARILGVPVRIEDYYGSGILLAAVRHRAHTLPRNLVFGLYDYANEDLPLVKNPLRVINGEIRLPNYCGPGLGVEVDEAILGDPVAVLGPA